MTQQRGEGFGSPQSLIQPVQLSDTCIKVQNPGASEELTLPVVVIPELPDAIAAQNCRDNLKLDVPWLKEVAPHDGVAVVCGSAPSLARHYADVAALQAQGATVFACNAAASLLYKQGVRIDYQPIADGSPLTLPLIFPEAKCHLLASILPEVFFKQAKNPVLWHPDIPAVVGVVDDLPRDFSYIGGGISVSMYTLCIAHTLGYRDIRCFGLDSSFDGEHFHVEDCSPVGDFIVTVSHAGKLYRTTYDMKMQAFVFLRLEESLRAAGTKVQVFGTGLLPDAFRAARACPSCGQLVGHYDDCEVGITGLFPGQSSLF